MYLLTKLAKHKAILTLAAMLVMGLALAPAAMGQTSTNLGFDPDDDTFGITDLSNSTKLGKQTLQQTVGNLINVGLGLLGIIAVVIVLTGGFKIMTAGGSDEKVAEGRKLITSGALGLAVILASFAIVRFILNALAVSTDFQGGLGNLNDL